MELGQYKLDRDLATIRSRAKSFALGTLYRGETFELHYIAQKGKYKDKWGWGYAYGMCNRWGWIEIKKAGDSAFILGSRKPLKGAPKPHRVIYPHEFSLRTNGLHLDHGTATNIDLTKGKHADRSKIVRLQGNRFSADPHDLWLHDGAPVLWRYVTRKINGHYLVMVNYQRRSKKISRWGFVKLTQLRNLK